MCDKLTLELTEAAEITGLSHWTLRKLIAQKKLIPVRINRRVLVERSELQRLIEKYRVNGDSGDDEKE